MEVRREKKAGVARKMVGNNIESFVGYFHHFFFGRHVVSQIDAWGAKEQCDGSTKSRNLYPHEKLFRRRKSM